jgi:hypothetical protein
VKNLVRTLVRTRAYQLSAESMRTHLAADPANRLVWRHAPRRLDAEEVRDAMLVAAGTLNRQRPAGSPANVLKMIEMRDNGPEARSLHEHADQGTHRSVYLPLLRGVTPHALAAFDPVEQTLVTGQRDATTVPSQALYLLNSSLVRRQALALAEQLLRPKDATEVARIHTAYRRTLGRIPREREVERARAFLAEYEADYRQSIASAPPANPDEIDQTGKLVVADVIQPKDARTAAWLAFAQALFGSAEFRYLP